MPHISDFTELNIDVSASLYRMIHTLYHKFPIKKGSLHSRTTKDIIPCPSVPFVFVFLIDSNLYSGHVNLVQLNFHLCFMSMFLLLQIAL